MKLPVREKRGVPWNYMQQALFPHATLYQYKRLLAKSIKEYKQKLAEKVKGENI